jgi:hypothetical protein
MKKGARCSVTCASKNHRTFGECMRSKNFRLNPNLADTGKQKAWDRELDSYEAARNQGVEPRGTSQKLIDEAMRTSEATGVAYQA